MLERFKLGQIVNAVGLKGETRVYPYTDYKERFDEIKELYIENQLYIIEKVRYMGKVVVIKFSGIDDRTAAENLKGSFLYVDRKDARILEEDEFFIADLIGINVIDEDGNIIGILSDVIQNTSQDLYEIETTSGRKILVPAVEDFIIEINIKEHKMTIRLIEGLMDL